MSGVGREALAAAVLVFGLATGSGCDGDIRLGEPTVADGGAGDGAGNVDAGSAGCTSDGECGASSLHCDVAAASCVACTVDAHCTREEQPRCDGATHRCVECGVSADCRKSGFVCEPLTRKCVPGCTSGTQCPEEAKTCDVGRSICVACTVDASCPSAQPHCENGSGRCVQCSEDAHCGGEKPRCVRETGRCADCLSAADCPGDKPICDPATWSCTHSGD